MKLSKLFNDKTWREIVAYSHLDLPVTDFLRLPDALAPSRKDMQVLSGMTSLVDQQSDENLAMLAANMGWEKPSLHMIYKVCKYHQRMHKHLPQYRIDGVHNVWIVKPCYNARGFGIHCTNDLYSDASITYNV